MGLLRRPTPGEIVEGGRLGRPYGPGAHSRASQKTNLRLRRHSRISPRRLLYTLGPYSSVLYGPEPRHNLVESSI